MAELRRRSPLSEFAVDGGPARYGRNGVTLTEKTGIAILSVMAGRHAAQAEDLVQSALGFAPPRLANGVAGIFPFCAWMSAKHWHVLCPETQCADLLASLTRTLAGVTALVSDKSHGYSLIELAGHSSRTLLAEGCPLDLHASVFAPGQGARSLLAMTPIHILQTTDAPTYWITVDQADAHVPWRWLVDAASRLD